MSQPTVFRLPIGFAIKPFDCGDSDLNDFLLNDAQAFQAHRLAVTYLLEDEQSTMAFFSLLNDKMSVDDFQGDNTSRVGSTAVCPTLNDFAVILLLSWLGWG